MADFENSDEYYACNSIHSFFDTFGIGHTISYLESGMIAAAGTKVWKREAPGHLVLFIDKLEMLCTAAFVLRYNHAKGVAIVKPPPDKMPDMGAAANFIDSNYHSNAWNHFPRSLTATQYHNPYKAIKKFCRHMAEPEWKKFFKELTEYALSKSSIGEIYPPHNILKIRLRLLQLAEACHLIEARLHNKKIKPKELK